MSKKDFSGDTICFWEVELFSTVKGRSIFLGGRLIFSVVIEIEYSSSLNPYIGGYMLSSVVFPSIIVSGHKSVL